MLRKILLAGIAVTLAVSNVRPDASAQYLVAAPAMVVPVVPADDVVAVAEPVYYAPARVQTTYVAYRPTYVTTVSDAIVTPYGYTPVVSNGYYQGYGYAPQYAFNPYYAGAAYGNGIDPLAASVVSAVAYTARNGGDTDAAGVVSSLISGFLASSAGPNYPACAPGYVVPQGVYVQPVQPQYVVPVAPAYVYWRGDGEGDQGEDGWHHDHGHHYGWFKLHDDEGD